MIREIQQHLKLCLHSTSRVEQGLMVWCKSLSQNSDFSGTLKNSSAQLIQFVPVIFDVTMLHTSTAKHCSHHLIQLMHCYWIRSKHLKQNLSNKPRNISQRVILCGLVNYLQLFLNLDLKLLS